MLRLRPPPPSLQAMAHVRKGNSHNKINSSSNQAARPKKRVRSSRCSGCSSSSRVSLCSS